MRFVKALCLKSFYRMENDSNKVKFKFKNTIAVILLTNASNMESFTAKLVINTNYGLQFAFFIFIAEKAT